MTRVGKEKLYKRLWLVTGFGLGVLAGGTLELIYLYNDGQVTLLFGLVYLATVAGGLYLGYLAGPVAWEKIYIDGVRGKKYVIK